MKKVTKLSEVVWEHEIGDIVMFKSAIEDLKSERILQSFGSRSPIAFEIRERTTVECHGGLQCFYKLQGLSEPLTPHHCLLSLEEGRKQIAKIASYKSGELLAKLNKLNAEDSTPDAEK